MDKIKIGINETDNSLNYHGNYEMEYYLNRNGRFYFRTLDRREKIIITADLKSIPALKIKYKEKLLMGFETN
jgi:hypothetical protein